jgi:hypothetical protein
VQVFEDGVFEFLLLPGRICIVEPGNEFAIECFVSEIVVQERGFGMADVEVSPDF